MYVARYTHNHEEDIKRGWSGWMGESWENIDEAKNYFFDMAYPDDEELEKKQQRYINTWGDMYEDWEYFINELKEEVLEENDVRFDEFHGEWRHCHHDGLSCWKLFSDTIEEAVAEATAKDRNGKIGWYGQGYATVGDIAMIAHVKDDLYIFECDDAIEE